MKIIFALVFALLVSGMLCAQAGKTPVNIQMSMKEDPDAKTVETFAMFWAGSESDVVGNITLNTNPNAPLDAINLFLLENEPVYFQQCLLNETKFSQCPPNFHECEFPDLLNCSGACCSKIAEKQTDDGGAASALFELRKSVVVAVYSGNNSFAPARNEERVYLPGEEGYEPWSSPLFGGSMTDVWFMIGGTVASLVAFLVFRMLFRRRH
ncbi:MAG: hypothetical protein V1909_00550 [Candidatus Micrarchaeota archaeon]